MSIVRSYSVFCDGTEPDGRPCAAWVAETTAGAVEARATARAHGWTRKNGRDLCPDEHQADE